ncbi:MAG: hypothetical protein M3065_15075 [Actinomycetota bacterium]|nr:hypothetical protein [Actinomycetota bacterium]
MRSMVENSRTPKRLLGTPEVGAGSWPGEAPDAAPYSVLPGEICQFTHRLGAFVEVTKKLGVPSRNQGQFGLRSGPE